MISSYHRPEQFITPLETYNLKRKNENENEINAVKRMRTVHQLNTENYAANNLFTPPQTPTAVPRTRILQPPAVSRALQPPAAARTLQPPAAARTLQPPAAARTLQPPAVARTLQPLAVVRTLQPPAVARTLQPPAVARTLQPPIVARTLQPPKPNLIISNPVQFEQYSLAHHVQV